MELLEREARWDLEETDRAIAREKADAVRFPRNSSERSKVRRAERAAGCGATASRQSIAHHEAGHIVALWAEGGTPRGAVVYKDGGQATEATGTDWPLSALLAGGEAEKLAGFREGAPSSTDLDLARDLVIFMPRWEADKYIECAKWTARRLLQHRWRAVSQIVDHLLAHGWINGTTAVRIIESTGARRA